MGQPSDVAFAQRSAHVAAPPPVEVDPVTALVLDALDALVLDAFVPPVDVVVGLPPVEVLVPPPEPDDVPSSSPQAVDARATRARVVQARRNIEDEHKLKMDGMRTP